MRGADGLAGVGVPQPHRAVGAGDGQPVPVGAERQTANAARCPGQRGADGLAGVGDPTAAPRRRRCRWPVGARRG